MISDARLIRCIRGPVMLITLGVLLIIHQFTSASFSQLWPVLVIVLGIMILLERLSGQGDPGLPPPSSGGPFGTTTGPFPGPSGSNLGGPGGAGGSLP